MSGETDPLQRQDRGLRHCLRREVLQKVHLGLLRFLPERKEMAGRRQKMSAGELERHDETGIATIAGKLQTDFNSN